MSSTDPTYDKDDTVKNLRKLGAMQPKSGRVIQEDGDVVNIADIIDETDPLNPTVKVTEQNAEPGADTDADLQVVSDKLVLDPEYDSKVLSGALAAADTSLKDSECAIGSIYANNDGSQDPIYLQFFNKNTALSGDTVDNNNGDFEIPLYAGQYLTINKSDFPSLQKYFSEGVRIGLSTTSGIYTAYGTPSEVRVLILFK